jgi:uncharacterized protein YkwD
VADTIRFTRLAAAFALAVALAPGARAADTIKPGVIANGALTPQAAPAAQLGPSKAWECPRSAILSDLEKQAAELAKKKQLPSPQKDGQLCAVATTFLSWKDDGQVPPSLAGPVAQHLGVVARPEVQVASFESGAPEDVVPGLLQALAGFLTNARQPRYGVAVEKTRIRGPSGSRAAEERKDAARVVLVMLDAPVVFQPFPRRLEAGASAVVTGELVGDWSAVKVTVSDELGVLSTPEQAPGKAFKAEVKCGQKPGQATLEVRGEAAAGGRTLATVAVQCGGELPRSYPLARQPWPRDAAGQEQKMAEAINADRAALGLPALEYDAALAGVARTVAEQLRDALAEGRAPTVDTGGLLKDAGLASPVLLQNPGEAPTAEEAQARFSLSPSTRQNLYSAEVNHMGIGLATAGEPGGRTTVVVIQLFTKSLPPADVAQVKQELYAEVQKKREEFKAPEAKVDPQIDKVMQQYAEAMAAAGGKLSDDQANELTHPLRAPFKSINMIEGAKASVADFLKDSTVTWDGEAMGAGVAQGTHPVLGKNALFFAFVVATPRPPEKAPAAAKSTPVIPQASQAPVPAPKPAKPAKPAGKKKP